MSILGQASRILIVDDSEHIHELFSQLLTSRADCSYGDDLTLSQLQSTSSMDSQLVRSFALSHARSGSEATELLAAAHSAAEPFALAFIDLEMPPGMNGCETAQMLWKVDPCLQVVLCASSEGISWGQISATLGHVDQLFLLKKPVDDDVAVQLAIALTEKWRLAAETRDHLWRLQREADRRLEVEANLRRMAEHDSLTNLPNRSVLLDRLAAVLRGYVPGTPTRDAILFLDLDNFKTINDTLGHHAGDDLLNQVADRLRCCVRDHDTTVRNTGETVRLGGDEFVVLLERLQRPDDAVRAARRIVERIAEPFRLGDRYVNVGSSVGVAFVDGTASTPEQLLQNADTAMYRAKLSGKGRVAVFDRGMHEDVSARLELESSLRNALDNCELNILYQPIVDLRSGAVRSVEALLRWTTSDGQAIPPSRFIPLAEEIGLITEIGYWTIERATADLVDTICQLDPRECPELELSVNVSHLQLSDPDFEQRLNTILHQTRFPRRLLKLEINESIAMRKPRETSERLGQLSRAGYGISMDDFGTGHSSLACFYQFPVETVKIDRTFVGSIAHNLSHQAIVQAVISLAHSLNTTVVAEGLESMEQIRHLRDLGCDRGQGYFFSSPVSLDQLLELVRYRLPMHRLREACESAKHSPLNPFPYPKIATVPGNSILSKDQSPAHLALPVSQLELPQQTLETSDLPL